MGWRKFGTAVVLTANLGVLVATSYAEKPHDTTYTVGVDTGGDTGVTTATTVPTSTTDTGTTDTALEPTFTRAAAAGPLPLAFDADTRTVAFEVQLDVGQELLDVGTVNVVLAVTAAHTLSADAVLSLYDLAAPADPLPEIPLATAIFLAAPSGAVETLVLQLPVTEGGITVHHVVLALGGEADLAGEVSFTLLAETSSEMLLPPLVIEVL